MHAGNLCLARARPALCPARPRLIAAGPERDGAPGAPGQVFCFVHVHMTLWYPLDFGLPAIVP